MIVLLIINLPFAPLWAKPLKIPEPYLYGGIAVFCGLGIYATSASTFELFVLLGIAIISFVLKRYGVPLAPLMIGMVLGPLAETNLRDAPLASGNDLSVLISSPIAVVLYLILIAALIYTGTGRVLARRRRGHGPRPSPLADRGDVRHRSAEVGRTIVSAPPRRFSSRERQCADTGSRTSAASVCGPRPAPLRPKAVRTAAVRTTTVAPPGRPLHAEVEGAHNGIGELIAEAAADLTGALERGSERLERRILGPRRGGRRAGGRRPSSSGRRGQPCP